MPNEQTSVPLFASGEVLTASNLNLSAGTGVPVFSDSTTRNAGFGGANEKVLAEGQLCYLSDSNIVQYYTGAAWATVGPASAGGLVYITQATPSAVNSVSINNCFTSTYDNYLVTFTTSASVGVDAIMTMRLRASATDSTTNYITQRLNAYGTTIQASSNVTGTDDWYLGFLNATTATSYTTAFQVFNPALASPSRYLGQLFTVENAGPPNIFNLGGYHTTASAYDGFTVITAGTSFTGTIRVYGYANS